MNIDKRYKTGLVLSGGGARGFAHIGVLKALNEAGIFPDVISGVSAGAMAAALYADGNTPEVIMGMFKDTKTYKYLEFALPKTNLLRMTKLTKIISANLKAKNFEDLKIPVYIGATDLNNGKCDFFHKGELLKCIIASSTVPVLFPPLQISGKTYVDGGVLNNFPVEPLWRKCDLLIGVNVNPTGYQAEFKNMISIAERSFHLCFSTTLQKKMNKCDIFIEPEGLENFKLLDLAKNGEIYQLGYSATRKAIKKNSTLIFERIGLQVKL